MKTLRVSDALHKYLMDHKNADHNSTEKVIFGQINLNDALLKILLQFCGEFGDNEGAVETLERLTTELKERRIER